jgi:hypothetical protein
MQMVDGVPVTITVRKGRSADGVPDKHARIIRKLIPIRDAVREVLKAQELDRPWKPAQVKLRIAWSNFRARFRADQHHGRLDQRGSRRPVRCARRIAVRTCNRFSTIPIAGWSPPSRTTTSRPTRRGPVRSSPNG